ncbi:MAG: NgoFVII family restriction endonuclease, partial [Bacteroidetes bacterium]|nr:NgoFVII family restriction endonuclease [Bacteroidota bacterium]
MYTNLIKHGGDFRDVLDKEFPKSKNVTIATGYASLDILQAYEKAFVRIAKAGGVSRLLLGMAFYEGLSQKKLDSVNSLNNRLKLFSNGSGVYVTNGRRYHGKVYHFDSITHSDIYVGSSNFS